MWTADFEFEFLTPALLAGADQKVAEMRIPSLRGALRWWTRLLGDKKTEDLFFGCVDGDQCRKSPASFRLLESKHVIKSSQDTEDLTGDEFDYFLWPLRTEKGKSKDNARGVIWPSSRFRISCRVDLDEGMDDWILYSFLIFGALGTRSRRAYGSVWPTKIVFDDEEQDIPRNIDGLKEFAAWFFEKKNIALYQLSRGREGWKEAVQVCARFLRTLRCGKSQFGMQASKWGNSDHQAGLDEKGVIYRASLGLPLEQRYSKSGKIVKYSIDGWDRFSSPLHFKVVKMEDGFVPILLVLPQYAPKDKTPLIGTVNHIRKKFEIDSTLLRNLQCGDLEGAFGEDPKKEKFPEVKLIYHGLLLH